MLKVRDEGFQIAIRKEYFRRGGVFNVRRVFKRDKFSSFISIIVGESFAGYYLPAVFLFYCTSWFQRQAKHFGFEALHHKMIVL